jgi:hypothetical protein
MTGSPFSNNGSCINNSTPGDIVAFNNKTNGVGSSTSQAILSSGYVYGTGSQNNASGLNILTFTNNINSPPSGVLGGLFDGIWCMPDYYHNLISLGNPVDTANSEENSFRKGIHITSTNDVYISQNITIPLNVDLKNGFEYIVAYGKDIYIDPDVKEVDAILIAQPVISGRVVIGGNIYTCHKPNIDPIIFKDCINSLTIKGALLANNVHMERRGNTTSSLAENSVIGCEPNFAGGEQICFSPLYWLSGISNGTSVTTRTDYVQQLPPTL